LTVEVEFVVTDQEARQLLELLSREQVSVFYALFPARFGVTGSDSTAD